MLFIRSKKRFAKAAMSLQMPHRERCLLVVSFLPDVSVALRHLLLLNLEGACAVYGPLRCHSPLSLSGSLLQCNCRAIATLRRYPSNC